MNKIKKAVLILIGIIVSFFLLVFIIPNILSLFSKDIVYIDDGDLNLKKIKISQEENAYYDLINMQFSDFNAELIRDHLAGKAWDEDFVKETLSQNEKALNFLNQAIQKPKFQDPEFESPENFSLFTPLTSLSSGRNIAFLSSLKAIYLAKQGRGSEALEEAVKSIDIGQKIQKSQAPLIYYLVAVAMKSTGLNAMQEIIGLTDFSPETIIQYVRKLEEFEEDKEWLVTAFKGEYSIAKESIDLVMAGDQNTNSFLSEEPSYSYIKPQSTFYFQPNKTKMIFAEYTRSAIENSKKPCGLIKVTEIKLFNPPRGIKAIFTENLIGKILHDIVAVSFSGVYQKSCEVDLKVSASRALLAIKAYNIENDKYPISLNELVPEYIEEIPIDPYSGENIKYSETKKIIYSVGNDLIDLGGSEGENIGQMKNPTFQINF